MAVCGVRTSNAIPLYSGYTWMKPFPLKTFLYSLDLFWLMKIELSTPVGSTLGAFFVGAHTIYVSILRSVTISSVKSKLGNSHHMVGWSACCLNLSHPIIHFYLLVPVLKSPQFFIVLKYGCDSFNVILKVNLYISWNPLQSGEDEVFL